MIFADEKHRQFYAEKTEKLKPDIYLRTLIYTLGICDDTRRNWNSLYDEKDRSICLEATSQGWQTGTTLKVTRLAFQLFKDSTPTAYQGEEYQIRDFDECQRYSVSDIFACGYAPFFVQAIKLRYPEFFTREGISV